MADFNIVADDPVKGLNSVFDVMAYWSQKKIMVGLNRRREEKKLSITS
jgi:hypothetical protein